MMKNWQEKFQGATITVEDAVIKATGLNLCGAHCIVYIGMGMSV
jgi:hypothetical protein